MPWNWKADILSFGGWVFETTGTAVVTAGAIGNVILNVSTEAFNKLVGKSINYIFKTRVNVNITTNVEIRPSDDQLTVMDPIHLGPINRNFTKSFSKNGTVTPVSPNAHVDSTLSIIAQLLPMAIPAGWVVKKCGESLSKVSSHYRHQDLIDAFEQGQRDSMCLYYKTTCCKAWMYGTLSSALHSGAAAMMFAGLMMQSSKEILSFISNKLPVYYSRLLPSVYTDNTLDMGFNIVEMNIDASIDISLMTSNTTASIDLSKIRNSIIDTNNTISSFIPYTLFGSACVVKMFAAKLGQWSQYYAKYEEGQAYLPKLNSINNTDQPDDLTEMGYRRVHS